MRIRKTKISLSLSFYVGMLSIMETSLFFCDPSFAMHDKLEALIEFDTLTQSRTFRGEEFHKLEGEIKEGNDSPQTFKKYLKLWPSIKAFPKQDSKVLESAYKDLQERFYTVITHAENKFQEAQVSLYFAKAMKPLSEDAYKAGKNRAQRCLNNILFQDNAIKENASPQALFWAWKHRKHLDFSFIKESSSWFSVLEKAAMNSYSKGSYELARLYEKGEEGAGKDPSIALTWYEKASQLGYIKATLHLMYKSLQEKSSSLQSDDIEEFYQTVAEAKFPYAQFLRGQYLLSQEAKEPSQQGFLLLLDAARAGMIEAQASLDDFYEKHVNNITHFLSIIEDKNNNNKMSPLNFQERAQGGSAFDAYLLARLYEDGQASLFTNPAQWFEAYEKALYWYKQAELYDVKGADKGIKRIQKKKEGIEKAKGYILNKIIKQESFSFSPKHPLFEKFTEFINLLYKYSPGTRYLGICILQQILETDIKTKEDIKKTKTIIENLSKIINSNEFKQQLSEEETEPEQAQRLFQTLLKATQPTEELKFGIQFQNPDTELSTFLSDAQGFIIKKLLRDKKQASAFSPEHPLFESFCKIIEKLSRYEGSVPEHGAYLVQQLLEFPPRSLQAKALTQNLLGLLESKVFLHGKPDDEKLDVEERRAEKLAEINEAIEIVKTRKKLLSPKELPEHVQVNSAIIKDPRIKVYNTFFSQDENPYDPEEFDKALDYILQKFDTLMREGKILKEMLLEDKTSKTQKDSYGTRESLRNLLTNAEDFGKPMTNQFAHRLIKIADIFRHGKLNDDTLAAQLSAWAIAGLHCKTRSEDETREFYLRNVSTGQTSETEDATRELYKEFTQAGYTPESEEASLEMKVALCLADLRRQLFMKIVPNSEVERIHQVKFLEKLAARKLGLIDPPAFEDPHQKIVKEKYRNMTKTAITTYVLQGDSTYKVNIKPGEGYCNAELMVNHVSTTINTHPSNNNNNQLLITSSHIIDRFKADYGEEEGRRRIDEYFDEDTGKITQEGAKALLYSLGYIEKYLPPLEKKPKSKKENTIDARFNMIKE